MDSSIVFKDLLDFLLSVWDLLAGFGETVISFVGTDITVPLTDVQGNWTGHYVTVSILQFIFGTSIVVYFGGMMWKWLKEFIN